MTAKEKSKYWGIQEGDLGIGFTGTFTECWERMVKDYGNETLAKLNQQDIRITRVK